MNTFTLMNHSHRRYNILIGEWIQVSPHRNQRPWQGQVEKKTIETRQSYDEDCYLCPKNKRANGEINPNYPNTFSFVNDFSAMQSDIPTGEFSEGLLLAKSEKGICKVVCFSPYHNQTIPDMEVSAIKKVIDLWIEECYELSKLDYINYIQIFENKGAIMGCSNPHPHGQIWAQESIPVEPMKKQIQQKKYFEIYKKNILLTYLEQEIKINERIIVENKNFVLLVPFWAVWPFETMIIPKRAMKQIVEMNDEERQSFAEMYKMISSIYDKLFETSFPYSAGIHQAPYDNQEHNEWQWHMVFYPPLLRSATVKKFMVGYELLANPQRDITAELAAQKLKSLL